ncbi:unnamed protein product [Cunninghamella blakesleeana]
MFFSKPTPISSFNLNVSSTKVDKTVAFGPGSVINGSLTLNNSQLLDVYELSVLFHCQIKQKNKTSTFFKVKEIILNKKKEYNGCKVEIGNHLYLFAIQLPINNYPPSISFEEEYEIEYTLQGYLEHSSTHTILYTNTHPIIYLPLVNVIQDKTFNAKEQQSYTRSSSSIELTAKLSQPSFYPGELCNVQVNTNNASDTKIDQLYITIISHLQTEQIIKQQVLYHQPYQVTIPKQTINHSTTLSLLLPYMTLPTFHYNENNTCIIIKHEMIISLTPNHHQQRFLLQDTSSSSPPTSPTSTHSKRFSTSSWFSSFYSNNNNNNSNNNNPSTMLLPPLLSFPLLITTIPSKSLLNQSNKLTIPMILEESSASIIDENDYLCKSSPLPTFIPTSTSPLLRSHLMTTDTDTEDEDVDELSDFNQYSVSPSSSIQWDHGSKNQHSMISSLPENQTNHTHLMVPSKNSHSGISLSSSIIE